MTTHRYFMLHKPFGYLSQFVNNQNKRRNKWLLGDIHDFPEGIMPIGRLDQSSEGLLLLTSDGKLSNTINSSGIEKEYYAMVDGLITKAAINSLKIGVPINVNGRTYITKPSKVFKVADLSSYPIIDRKVRDERHGPISWISITLTEGKFRQVRKMTAKVGFPTLRLIRVRVGELHLNIDYGSVKELEYLNV